MRDAQNIEEVSLLDIDFMGFIFYPRSPRCCSEYISAHTLKQLPESVTPVAVTVNMDYDALTDLSSKYGFRTFQLHGSESPQLCRRLREEGAKVIKAIGIKDKADLEKVRRYSGSVDYFLFDTSTPSHGGSGRKFDWKLLEEYDLSVPFLLSGGITSADADMISRFHHPQFAGIDLNSGFEIAPGLKDLDRIKKFIKR